MLSLEKEVKVIYYKLFLKQCPDFVVHKYVELWTLFYKNNYDDQLNVHRDGLKLIFAREFLSRFVRFSKQKFLREKILTVIFISECLPENNRHYVS